MLVKTAAIIGFLLIAIIIGIDVYLAADNVKNNTWSEMIRFLAFKTPLPPWIWGGLGGHYFHPHWLPKDPFGQPGSVVLLVWLSVVLGMAGIALYRANMFMPFWIVFFAAFFIWGILWPV